MKKQEILEILKTTGAYLRGGHFKLVSGNHSDAYVHVRLALAYPEYASAIGENLAHEFREDRIDAVVGFTVGGIELAKSVAGHLDAGLVLAKKKDGKIEFPKGHLIQAGEALLVVDDVLTTGDLIEQVLTGIRDETQGVVKGVGVVVDRGKEEQDFGVKTVSLLKIDMKLWPRASCPLCKQEKDLTDLSSPDGNPVAMLETLPEEIRPVLAIPYLEVLADLEAGKPLGEVVRIYRPVHEFPGEKPDRVAVLGAFEQMDTMIRIGRYAAASGYHAITSKLMFERNTRRSKEIRPYSYESMNDFLRRMIFSCQYIIVIYPMKGGQYIETAWCSQFHKPTLGLVELRPWLYRALGSCEYLGHDKSQKVLFCRGFDARKSGAKVIGGWICVKREGCPFPTSGLTKMVLDLYATNPTTFLVGSDDDKNFEAPVRNFLKNNGFLDLGESGKFGE